MSKVKMKTREEWLLNGVKALRPMFEKQGNKIPPVGKLQVGCGWPRKGKAEVIGQCFAKSWTSDGVTHIFISPVLGDDVEVLAVLVHELVHAAVGCEHGHRGAFKKLARALGLEGKLTATTVSAGTPLHMELTKLARGLGKYPHSKMTPGASGKEKGEEDKPKYKWPRLKSVECEEYTFQISPKLIEKYGMPMDFNGVEMVYKEGDADE